MLDGGKYSILKENTICLRAIIQHSTPPTSKTGIASISHNFTEMWKWKEQNE